MVPTRSVGAAADAAAARGAGVAGDGAAGACAPSGSAHTRTMAISNMLRMPVKFILSEATHRGGGLRLAKYLCLPRLRRGSRLDGDRLTTLLTTQAVKAPGAA